MLARRCSPLTLLLGTRELLTGPFASSLAELPGCASVAVPELAETRLLRKPGTGGTSAEGAAVGIASSICMGLNSGDASHAEVGCALAEGAPGVSRAVKSSFLLPRVGLGAAGTFACLPGTFSLSLALLGPRGDVLLADTRRPLLWFSAAAPAEGTPCRSEEALSVSKALTLCELPSRLAGRLLALMEGDTYGAWEVTVTAVRMELRSPRFSAEGMLAKSRTLTSSRNRDASGDLPSGSKSCKYVFLRDWAELGPS